MDDEVGGSVCNKISLLLTTDDVVKIRTTACRCNVETNTDCSGTPSSGLLKMEQFEKLAL